MRKHLATILPALVASALVAGCTGRSSSTATTLTPQPEETQSESTPQQRPRRPPMRPHLARPQRDQKSLPASRWSEKRSSPMAPWTPCGTWACTTGTSRLTTSYVMACLPQRPRWHFPTHQAPLHGTDGRSSNNHVLVTSGLDGKLVLPTDEQSGRTPPSNLSSYAY